MRRCETTKLFYGKYSYKIVLTSPIANWFRGGDLPSIRDTLDTLNQAKIANSPLKIKMWTREVVITTQDLHYAQKIYSALCKDVEYKIRVEGHDISIYSDDINWLESIKVDALPVITELWSPNRQLQPNTLIMSPAMTGWEYRITLGSSVPKTFSQWVNVNQDKIKIGATLKEDLSKEQTFLQGFYFYVKNEKMLNLVTLVLGSGISRIDKIIIEDKNA